MYTIGKLAVRRLLILLVCSLLDSLEGMAETRSTAAPGRTVSDIIREIEETAEKLDRDAHDLASQTVDAFVVALGYTREGKSTFLNWVANKNLVVRDGYYEIDVENPVPGMRVGHTAQSVTAVPCYWYDEGKRLAYFDGPGLGDSDELNEVRNAYTFQKLFALGRKIKVLLFLSEPTIRDQSALVFKETIKILSQMFSQDDNTLSRLSESLTLVVTKQHNFSNDTRVRGWIIEKIINPLGNSLPVGSRRLLARFQQWPIVFMPDSNVPGPYLDRNKRTQMIEQLHGALNRDAHLLNVVPLPIVSANARIAVQSIAQELSAEIIKGLKEDFAQKSVEAVQKGIAAEKAASKAREYIAKIATESNTAQSCNSQNFITEVGKLFDSLKITGKDQLVRRAELINFLRRVDSNISLSSLQDTSSFQALSQVLQKMSTPLLDLETSASSENNEYSRIPSYIYSDTRLLIQGYLLGLSDVNKVLNSQPSRKVPVVVVYAFHTLFFDEDLSLPGVTLCIIAPYWNIPKKIKVSLNGANGKAGDEVLATAFGTNGNPGYPGQSGGNFFGRCREGEVLTLLELDLSGGNGGKGTDGANGKAGEDGKAQKEKVDREKVEMKISNFLKEKIDGVTFCLKEGTSNNVELWATIGKESECLHWRGSKHGRKRTYEKINEDTITFERLVRTIPGGSGTKGGAGGIGGSGAVGGEPGKDDFGTGSHGLLTILKKNGKPGGDGKSGVGGDGGKGSMTQVAVGLNILKFSKNKKEHETVIPWLNKKLRLEKASLKNEKNAQSGQNGDTPDPKDLILVPKKLAEVIIPTFSIDSTIANYRETARKLSTTNNILESFLEAAINIKD